MYHYASFRYRYGHNKYNDSINRKLYAVDSDDGTIFFGSFLLFAG